jgi:hypothetical protein
MGIIDRKVDGFSFAFGESEDLSGGEIHNLAHALLFSSQEHMPGTKHVGRDNVFRSTASVVCDRPGVNDLVASFDGSEYRIEVPNIEPFGEIERPNRPPSRLKNGPSDAAQSSGGASQQHTTHLQIVSRGDRSGEMCHLSQFAARRDGVPLCTPGRQCNRR